MTWPAVKRGFSQEAFASYLKTITWPSWRPSRICWHNTASPSLEQWQKSAAADLANGIVPGLTRIKNLEAYFRDQNHWSGAPHLFIAPDLIWVFNPLDAPGVHSPSFNATSIGIEMVGDFDKEDDETGDGLKVKNNTIFATAMLCSAIGIEPTDGQVDPKTKVAMGAIFIHRQDPKTTHDCPGAHIAQDKQAMILSVQGLMGGGEHNDAAPDFSKPYRMAITKIGGLNLRSGPGVANAAIALLPINTKLEVLSEAKNGSTGWLLVLTPQNVKGWVAANYVKEG